MVKRIIGLVVTLLVATTATAAEVRLRSSAACSASIVRLADVAEVLTDDPRIATALAEIPLCPAPASGSQRLLSQQDVRQLLVLSGVESGVALITGSETVTVLSEAAMGASLSARRPLVATGIRQAVFEADVESNKHPQSRSASKPVPVPAAETKEPAPPPLVMRGAVVTVHARTAGVKITASGKALGSGGAGDTVAVELTDNKQRVLARVVGPQVVEVAAEGSTAALLR